MDTMSTQHERCMSALAIANHVRITNARTLKAIAAKPQLDGLDDLIEILANADVKGPIGSIPILRLLRSPRKIGDGKARQLLYHANIVSGDRKLRELTTRQRNVLVTVLRDPRWLWPRSGITGLRHVRGL